MNRKHHRHPEGDRAQSPEKAGQTFRLITFPQFRPAFVAGGLLAFALSFDEIVVTIFTAPVGVETLPLWIMNQMARPNEVNQVNVVATIMILLSLIPVYFSQKASAAAVSK